MGRKKGGMVDGPVGKVSSGESWDPVDAVDQINRDIGFLMEALKLVQVASLGPEEWRNISLVSVTEEMLLRLERVGNLCNLLLNPGQHS